MVADGGATDPGYRVKFERITIAGGADLAIRSLFDRMQFADPLGEAEAAGISPGNWPLFGLLWPSAHKLAELMQVHRIAGRRVLEIGCGLGLASLVIHRRCGDITASDCHPLTERFLRANLALNRLPAMPYRTGNWSRAGAALGEFDLIVGSDVLYERSQPEQLAAFLQAHAAPSAEIVIIDPNRGNRSAFNRCMAGLGFSLAETAIDAPLADGQPYHGRLLSYRRDC